MKGIAIIAGGIAGLVAAIHFHEAGGNAVIHEATPELGGLRKNGNGRLPGQPRSPALYHRSSGAGLTRK